MTKFKLKSNYKPSGDQPDAIRDLVKGIKGGDHYQTLLGATGTGKTFTIANVIKEVQRPTLVIAHNKTLAAQLCNEFRDFFPDNAVEYFVSYYDYYQPEAYIARSDTYIEKEAQVNEEIDRLRHSTTQSLLTRKDVIVCASVSCIYGLGAPAAYEDIVLHFTKGQQLTREEILEQLIHMQFTRNTTEVKRGTFRVQGGVIELMPANEEVIYRIEAPRDKIETILKTDPVSRKILQEQEDVWIFPAKHFIIHSKDRDRAVKAIRHELKKRLKYFDKEGKLLEAERLERKTHFDLEMMENLGYCNGIENYSRHLSGRAPGEPPDTLFSYFPDDILVVIDESHVTIPQVGGMSEGDRSRKENLVDYGFRLPSAKDNRPLRFKEFEERVPQGIFVSATPGPFERKESAHIVEQIIRPTGLIDPEVLVLPITPKGKTPSQVDDVIERIKKVIKRKDRILVTTLTKKMSEDLTDYLKEKGIQARYLHSDIKTIERLEILSDFRKGEYDVLVGVNLLREGLDLPEVSLVAIMDADKEGFLRSDTALIQTIGRAARNIRGQVILYADKVTGSMERAIDETNRRREKQLAYNEKHNITPKSIVKALSDTRAMLGLSSSSANVKEILKLELKAETHDLKTVWKQKEREMKKAAKDLQFELAAILRDELRIIQKEIDKRDNKGRKAPTPRKGRHGRTK